MLFAGSEMLMRLKIMTYNLYNGWSLKKNKVGDRDDLAASVILSHMPDVIGFQEVDPCYRLADNPLDELLSEHYSEAGETHTTWNPIFYNRRTVRVLSYGEETFRDGTEYPYPRGGSSAFRTVSYALLEILASGERFWVLNLHYDCNKEPSVTRENQLSESAQILELSTDLLSRHPSEALFVTGDYNSTVGSTACRVMLENGFADTRTWATEKDDVGTCATLGSPLVGSYESRAIDHVFCRSDRPLAVLSYQTIGNARDASDHAPVIVTLGEDE